MGYFLSHTVLSNVSQVHPAELIPWRNFEVKFSNRTRIFQGRLSNKSENAIINKSYIL